jgi:tRNA modification GTPase
VVVAGPPNVGKSSLVNALAGFQRSVVAETPGTTRDVVGTLLAIDGWPIELIDTAGLRGDTEGVEEEGVRRAVLAARSADLCLWVADASAAPPASPPTPGALLVVNKIDLPAGWDLDSLPGALRVSAKTGAGLAELCDALSRRLVPAVPAPGAAVPFTPEWCDRIEQAALHVAAGDVPRAKACLG